MYLNSALNIVIMKNYVILCVVLVLLHTVSQCVTLPSNKQDDSQISSEVSEVSSIQKRYAHDEGEDCDIVFPDKTSAKGGSTKRCRVSTFSAKGKGRKCIENVCGDATDYPYEQVEKIKHRLAGYLNLFGNLDGTKILTPRLGESEPMSLCPSTVHTIYPKTLKNDKETEKFIVNVEGHTQGLLLETCKEKATCMFAPLFPNTYSSECTQRYATRRLMALNEDGNPAFDSFVVPSCCACMVKQIKH